MRDLEDSLAATMDNAPVSNAEIRAKLAVVGARLDELQRQIDHVLAALKLIAESQTDLGHMMHTIHERSID